MAAGIGLIPNLGDDELLASGDPPPPRPGLATPARLWSLLFGAAARTLALAPGDKGQEESAWPEALGPRPDAPVFDWLPEDALVPWISTPGLWARFETSGRPIAATRPDIVARVHDKAFAHRVALAEGLLPAPLRDLVSIFDPGELRDADAAVARMTGALASWPEPLSRSFTLKPRFGTSGRGRVAGSAGEADTPAIRGALPRLAERGGALLEPWFARSRDLSAQLFVGDDGRITLLGTLEQIVAPSGLFLGHRGEIDSRGRVFSHGDFEESLREAAPLVAIAAAAEGYRGPCGVDAFALRLSGATDDGDPEREILRPVVELNARFTMGIVAIGLVRRALDRVRAPLGLEPGCRRAFLFALDAPSEGWEAAAASAGPGALLLPLDHAGESARPALLFAASSDRLDEAAARITGAKR
ncbi:MAG: hypothetical protein JRG96_02795 [Deltaproteobacteria bacterium]|nr:hypothetical protein [Deltaproteobacteria bacterium]